jgi:putative flippase GtrA
MICSPTRTLLAGFLSVGGLGFLLDVSVFQALFMVGYGPIASRFVSAGAAITLTWYLNRRHVFRTAQTSRSGPEYARYLVIQSAGLVVNLGIYLALLNSVQALREVPVIALCGGALVAITFNFLGARYWAFRTE